MPEAAGSDAADAATKASLLDMKIKEQIEYYFGDINILKDKFLIQETAKDPEGWVPVKTLLRFNRLAALTKDADVILKAFKNNPSSIVQISEDTKSIRRNPERVNPNAGRSNEAWRDIVSERSIYVKGFPLETTTLDDILNFMTNFGKVDNVSERKYHDKALQQWRFKGSAYVTFPTKEDAEQFLSIGSVKFNGHELIRKWQNDYMAEKKEERLKLKLEMKQAKEKLIKDQQEGLIKDIKLPKGALIALSGLKEGTGVNELKTTVMDLGWGVDFVDYTMGEPTAYIRLHTENSANEALAKLTDSSFQVKGVTVKATLVEGEEEEKLLEKMETEKKLRIMQNVTKIGKKGFKGKKNKPGKRGRYGDFEGRKDKRGDKAENAATKGEKMETENGKPQPSQNEASSKIDAETSGPSGEAVLKRKKDDEDADENATKKSKSDE